MTRVVVPARDVVFTDVTNGVALLNTRSNTYFSLNSVGADVWSKICDGETEAQIVEAIADLYDAPNDIISKDIKALIDNLKKAGLVTNGDENGQ